MNLNKLSTYTSSYLHKVFPFTKSYRSGLTSMIESSSHKENFISHEYHVNLILDAKNDCIEFYQLSKRIIKREKLNKANIRKMVKDMKKYFASRLEINFYDENEEWLKMIFLKSDVDYDENKVNELFNSDEKLIKNQELKEIKEKTKILVITHGHDGEIKKYKKVSDGRFYYYDYDILIKRKKEK